uniref:G-protein coupled receptors family 3 profile domain-containing protein n=1 Tax=Kryptolebias marmoratus TaxID=37003 RepID=A0A3Q3BIA6_KRYMA
CAGLDIFIFLHLLARIKSENQTALSIMLICAFVCTLPCVYSWNDRELKFARTMIFTVEEINRDPTLLPGVSLGYRVYNGCGTTNLNRAAVEAINGNNLLKCSGQTLAVLGHSSSGVSEIINIILSSVSIPQLSHLSTCACLSEKTRYPTFFRTVPSDHFQSTALVQLMEYFDWRWVGIIYSQSTYAEEGTTSFVKEAEKKGICVEYWLVYSRTSQKKLDTIVEALRKSSSKVVLMFMSLSYVKSFLSTMEAYNITGKQWVGSESWITQKDLVSVDRKHILYGAMDVTYFREENNVYKAHLKSVFPKVLENLKYVNFTTKNGAKVFFNENGDSVAQYDLVNWQIKEDGSVEIKQIGQYDDSLPEGQKLKLKKDAKIVWAGDSNEILFCATFQCYLIFLADSVDCLICPPEFWPNEEKGKCLPKRTEYLSYKDIMGALLTGFSTFGMFLSLLISIIFFTHKETPIVRANNSELSFLLLFSLKLCFLCSLTFIGRPTHWSCMLRHTAFSITFVLCISCVLGKTIVVLMAFKAKLPGSNVIKWFGPPQQRITIFIFTLIQVVICILWLTISPPFPSMNMQYYKDRIILECALGSAVGFWAVLGYIGLLAVLCFILAFLARKLPDSFNEARLITFSMLIFCAVWITFIPAYVSSPGKFTVAVEIFAILASSFGLLLCIFAPKCYIIILKPEQNTKKHLMGKKIISTAVWKKQTNKQKQKTSIITTKRRLLSV